MYMNYDKWIPRAEKKLAEMSPRQRVAMVVAAAYYLMNMEENAQWFPIEIESYIANNEWVMLLYGDGEAFDDE